jgi:DNA-binding NtrC family response regulator
VLLVDDSQLIVRSVSRLLTHRGYEVITAASVSAARTAIATEFFNVVLTDLRLADGSGLDVLEAVERTGVKVGAVVFTDESLEARRAGKLQTLFVSKGDTVVRLLEALGEVCTCEHHAGDSHRL